MTRHKQELIKMKMSPKIAEQIHTMRKYHLTYSAIHKRLGLTCKRSSMQHYYYKWMRDNNIKRWDITE